MPQPAWEEQPGQQGGAELGALGGGQVGHLGWVVGQPSEVVPGQLVGPETGLAELGHGRTAALRVQVSQVARRPGATAPTGVGRGVQHQRHGLGSGVRGRHGPTPCYGHS
jgi:hypothetical protein